MAQNFKVDQAGTFAGPLVFIQCVEKRAINAAGQSAGQAKTNDGTPKWELHLLGLFNGFGGQITPEVIKVGIASVKNPAEGLSPQTPVVLDGLELGVMEKTRKLSSGEEKIIGVNVWHRAEGIRPFSGQGVRGKSETAA